MSNIKNILQLSLEDKRKFFDSFDLIFFDCDGVIWHVIGTIPHTNKAINMLKDAGKECKFVSNNSVRSGAEYLEKFEKIGVRNVEADDIIHPAKSMVHYIKTHYPEDARMLSICSSPANNYFCENGLNIETMKLTEELSVGELHEIIDLRGQEVSAVLFDINPNLNYAHLAHAALYLQQGNCDLIAGGMDTYIPLTPNMTIIGFSYFEDILAKQTQKDTIVMGKPGAALADILMEMNKIKDPKRVLFIGDALKQDIGFGKKIGFQTLLVLTGTATKEDMLAAEAELQPDFYADSVCDFIILINDLKEKA